MVVLILVLMEDALRGMYPKIGPLYVVVLILVLMEDALRAALTSVVGHADTAS